MSTVQPPAPPTSGPVNGPGNATAVAIKVPPQILAQVQTIPLGQTLQATITQLATPNLLQVQTPLGALSLQTPMMLPKGAVLTLVLTNMSPPTFQIGQVNGKPVPGALTPNQAKVAGLLHPQLTARTGAPPAPLQVGEKATVTLLRPALAPSTVLPQAPAAQPSATAGQTASTPGGNTAQASSPAQGTPQASAQANQPGARHLSGGRPGAASAPSQSTPTAEQATPAAAPMGKKASSSQANVQASGTQTGARAGASQAAPAPSTQAATQATTGSNTLPSGTRFNVTVVQVNQPNAVSGTPATASAAASTTLTQGAVVTGRVTGHTPQGQTIVQTPTATFALESQGGLKEGAQVTLRLDTQPLPSTATQRPLSGVSVAQALVNQVAWDGMEEALTTLAAADPARFQQVAQTALPQPGAKLTNQLLFFISALKGGDLKGLFGDSATRVMDKERPGLLNRLMGDFQVMSRLADEPQSNDWRLALIPMWSGEKLEQLRLYYRGGGGKDDEDNDLEGARFILDFELSRIGRMQIDGLVKAQKKAMELIVRTNDALPATMRADITEMTIAADDLLDIQASVTFQAGASKFSEFPPLVDDPAMLGRPSPGVFA